MNMPEPENELTPGVNILRRVVIGMGFVLVFGTLALMIAVYFKFKHKPAETAPETYYSQQSKTMETCAFKPTGNIDVEGNIASTNLNGNILTISTENKAKNLQQVIIFDLCASEVLSRLNIVAKN